MMAGTLDTPSTPTLDPMKLRERQSITILKRCFCLVLSCGALGNTRNVKLDNIELRKLKDGEEPETITADSKQLALTKRLLDSTVLSKPLRVQNSAKNYLQGVAIQGHRVFGPGTYLIPTVMVTEVDGRLKMIATDLAAAVEEFKGLYKAEVAKRQAKLGQLFNAADYLSPEDAAAQFHIDWDYRRFDAPDNLETMDRAIFDATQAKHQQQMSDAYGEWEKQMMAGALTVMRELRERLQPKADGTTKSIYGTALDDLKEYLRTLPFRNVTDNDKLARIMAEVEKGSAGIDIKDLRGSEHVRKQMIAITDQAVQQLDGLIQENSGRAITFGSMALPTIT